MIILNVENQLIIHWSVLSYKGAATRENQASGFPTRSDTNRPLQSQMMARGSCADPEIFMRGGPTKMVIFGHRRGGVQPPENPEITFFLGKFFKFQGGSGPPVPPSGSAHEAGNFGFRK